MAPLTRKTNAVPKRIHVMGHAISVKRVSDPQWKALKLGEDAVGFFDPASMQILIRRTPARSFQGQTYWHEALHAALHSMGHPLYDDEGFVDTLSGIIHQIVTTAEY